MSELENDKMIKELLDSVGCKTVNEYIDYTFEMNNEIVRLARREEKKNKIEKLLKESGMGKKFYRRTFKSFERNEDNEKAYQQAASFAKEFPNSQGLFFAGTVGVGKTHLAAAIANHLIGKMHTVYFGSITKIITKVKETFSKKSDITEGDLLNMLINDVDLLIIDDIGKENSTEYSNTFLYHLINELYEEDKPIIITTNLMPSELKIKLGERGDAVMSRILEMTIPVAITGKDWRKKGLE